MRIASVFKAKSVLFTLLVLTTVDFAAAVTATPTGNLQITTQGQSQNVNATIRKGAKCNTNEHCKNGWYCLDGVAENGNIKLQGACTPNIVSKHLCHLTKMLSSRIGRIIVLFGILFLGLSILQAKFDWKAIVTTVIGIVLILAPFSFLSLFTKDMSVACDFILSTQEIEKLVVS